VINPDTSPVSPDLSVPRSAFIALALAAFGSGMSMRVADPMLVRLSTEFSHSIGEVSAVITVFSVAYGLAQLLFGPLGDRYGKYLVIAVACFVCSFTSLLCAAAQNFSTLVMARLLAGASCAALIPLSMAWIGDVVSYAERQPVLARFMIGLILGNGVGVFVGGLCADHLDWRIPFVLISVSFFIAGGYLMQLRRQLPKHALSKEAQHDEGIGYVADSLLRSFKKVLQIAWARVVLLSVFIEGALVFGTLAFIPTILHLRLGLSLTAAGSMVMLFGVGGLGFALFAPLLVRVLGEQWLIRLGVSMMCGAMLTIGFSLTWYLSLPACFVFGLGFYMMHNTLQTNATQMAPERRGAAVAAFASCYFFGQAVGIGFTGYLLEKVDPAQLSVWFATALLITGLWFAAAYGRR
jgi:predicted MFS family arabinose efflux permease